MRSSVPLKVPVMKRMSAPTVRPLPVPVPVPSMSAMAIKPLKSVMVEGAGSEPSTITDFNGFIAIADIEGTGTGTGSGLTVGADMRFMTGTFRGTDDRIHSGTFGFI